MIVLIVAAMAIGLVWAAKVMLAVGFKHWFFRRVVNFGPLRFTLAKSGIGRSIGGFGARLGRSANGRRYIYMRGPFGTYYRRYFHR